MKYSDSLKLEDDLLSAIFMLLNQFRKSTALILLQLQSAGLVQLHETNILNILPMQDFLPLKLLKNQHPM